MGEGFEKDRLKAAVAKELEAPFLGTTKQFLAVHKSAAVDGEPAIIKIVRDGDDDVIVYLAVEGERFFLGIRFDYESGSPKHSWSQEFIEVQFFAMSGVFDADKMKSMTSVPVSESWTAGEQMPGRLMQYKFSRITIAQDDGPAMFENKLERLLALLESDGAGIRRIVDSCQAGISVVIYYHNENGMLGGPTLEPGHIKRLANLGLSIGFDQYAFGNLLR